MAYSGEGHLINGSDPLGYPTPVAVDFDGKLLIQGSYSPSVSTDGIGSQETVFTTATALLAPNANRKGLVIQINSTPVNIWLGTTAVPTYNLSPNSVLEIENYIGSVLGTVDSGSTTILVTEKI